MRFVVITLPPEPVGSQIEALRRPVNDRFGCTEALRYPPHLTLRTGLVCPDDRAAEAADAFLAHAAAGEALPVQTLGVFHTTYGDPEVGMVGWSVPLTEHLLSLHHHLLRFTEWQKGPQPPFRPHLSLIYGDLRPGDLHLLREEDAYRAFPDFRWTLDHVALYHETPDGWVEWGRTALRSSPGAAAPPALL